MRHDEFKMGMVFWSVLRCQPYYVTDIGQRVIVASIFTGPEDLTGPPGHWIEFVIPAAELEYCTTECPAHTVPSYARGACVTPAEAMAAAAPESIDLGPLEPDPATPEQVRPRPKKPTPQFEMF